MKYLLIFTTILLAGELEVDGNLKVTGTVDAQGNPITNVGSPLLSTDAANAGYVLNAAGKGRIITLKCGWVSATAYDAVPTVGSCEPPSCPNGWNNLIVYTENTAASGASNQSAQENILYGNSVRLCIEQEETK